MKKQHGGLEPISNETYIDKFGDQIVAIELKSRKGVTQYNTDEHVRYDCTIADMEKLRTVFKKDGTVTAGNSSGINDAAAAVVMADSEYAEKNGLKPIAKLVGYAFAGVAPEVMGIGPVPAVNKLLEKIREYIWYSETRTSYKKPKDTKDSKHYLGTKEDSVYYFIYVILLKILKQIPKITYKRVFIW